MNHQNPNENLLSQVALELRDLRALISDLRMRLDGVTKPFLTVEEVARLSGRAPYTIRDWIKRGRLAATRVNGTGPRGRLLVARTELERVIETGLGGHIPSVAIQSDAGRPPLQ